MIIFGFRTSVARIGMLTVVCGACGNPAAQSVHRRTTKFSLFFVPLFPVRTRYDMQCSYCGTVRRVDKAEALRLAA